MKLSLNDASFHLSQNPLQHLVWDLDVVFWFIHLEIIQERLSREFDLNLITTSPSVVYKI